MRRDYEAALADVFTAFPMTGMRSASRGSAISPYSLTPQGASADIAEMELEAAIEAGFVSSTRSSMGFPAGQRAGIFQSNLGDDAAQDFVASPNQRDVRA